MGNFDDDVEDAPPEEFPSGEGDTKLYFTAPSEDELITIGRPYTVSWEGPLLNANNSKHFNSFNICLVSGSDTTKKCDGSVSCLCDSLDAQDFEAGSVLYTFSDELEEGAYFFRLWEIFDRIDTPTSSSFKLVNAAASSTASRTSARISESSRNPSPTASPTSSNTSSHMSSPASSTPIPPNLQESIQDDPLARTNANVSNSITDTRISTAGKIGIGIASVVALILISTLIFFLVQMRRKRRTQMQNHQLGNLLEMGRSCDGYKPWYQEVLQVLGVKKSPKGDAEGVSASSVATATAAEKGDLDVKGSKHDGLEFVTVQPVKEENSNSWKRTLSRVSENMSEASTVRAELHGGNSRSVSGGSMNPSVTVKATTEETGSR